MPSDEHKGQLDSFEYGASVTREVVDFSPDSSIESVRPLRSRVYNNTTTTKPGSNHNNNNNNNHSDPQASVRDKALMDKLRDALRPGDAKKYGRSGSSGGGAGDAGSGTHGDTTHDGRHGGIEETMKPGHRDYDEREENTRRGSVLDALDDSKHEGRRGSILDRFHLGQHHRSQYQRTQEGSNARPQDGGVMSSMKEKTGKAADHIDSFRDSTDSKRPDAGRLPGNLYRSLRDDAFK